MSISLNYGTFLFLRVIKRRYHIVLDTQVLSYVLLRLRYLEEYYKPSRTHNFLWNCEFNERNWLASKDSKLLSIKFEK